MLSYNDWLMGQQAAASQQSSAGFPAVTSVNGVSGSVLTTNSTGQLGWGANTIIAAGTNSCVHTNNGTFCTQCQMMGGGMLGGGGGGAAAGFSYTVPSTGTYTISTGAVGQPLTPDEIAELNILREQHATETKALKKQKFRELHPELRQMVIAMLVWGDKCTEIGNADASRSDRMKELESKRSNLSGFTGQNYGYTIPFNLPFSIPTGLTRQDLEEAHVEATIEEELLSYEEPKSESK